MNYISAQNMTKDSYESQKEQTAKDAAGEEVIVKQLLKKRTWKLRTKSIKASWTSF